MENASRALLMAAGILIAILIISALVIMFSQIADYESQTRTIEEAEQLAEFNNQFLPYDENDVTIMELKSLYNKIVSHNTTSKDLQEITLTINDDKEPIAEVERYMKEIPVDQNFKNTDEYVMNLLETGAGIPETVKMKAEYECTDVYYYDDGQIKEMVFEDNTEQLTKLKTDDYEYF